MKIGDCLICWNDQFVSIDKVIDIYVVKNINEIDTNYLLNRNKKNYWREGILDFNAYNVIHLKDYLENPDKYPYLKSKKQEINSLLKDFFKKYKKDGRKIKLNKLL